MKILFLFLGFITSLVAYSQFTPVGTTTSDNKFRTGGIALGYSALDLPQFNANKLMIKGNQFINGRIDIGTTSNISDSEFKWGIKSQKPFLIINDNFPLITLRTGISPNWSMFEAAVATGDYYFNNLTKAGDVVLRGHTRGSYIIGNTYAGDIKFTTRSDYPSGSDLVRMIIDKDGRIGIGTETPDAELAVNGLIHTKEVKVDLQGWPDYVFFADYELPTLEEVEKHIIDKGHLVNIPSATEVEKSGVELGKMNKALLKKIEELTLYIIKMNKDIEELKKHSNVK